MSGFSRDFAMASVLYNHVSGRDRERFRDFVECWPFWNLEPHSSGLNYSCWIGMRPILQPYAHGYFAYGRSSLCSLMTIG